MLLIVEQSCDDIHGSVKSLPIDASTIVNQARHTVASGDVPSQHDLMLATAVSEYSLSDIIITPLTDNSRSRVDVCSYSTSQSNVSVFSDTAAAATVSSPLSVSESSATVVRDAKESVGSYGTRRSNASSLDSNATSRVTSVISRFGCVIFVSFLFLFLVFPNESLY